MKMGKVEAIVIKGAFQRRQEIPENIQNAPELLPGLQMYYDAFIALTSCRSLGYGVMGGIPWTAINDYAERYEIHGAQFDRLVFYVQALDNHYLNEVRKKAPS
jgi:hypothetical protein